MESLTLARMASPLAAALCAPLLLGIVNRTKALFAGRTGQPLLQPYFDIIKLLRKGTVYSRTTTAMIAVGPVVSVGAMLCATLYFPLTGAGAPLRFAGDVLLFLYLFGLVRFFTVVAALDTGSPFEGMGASREVFFSALAEPVLLLGLLSLCTHAPSFSLSAVFGSQTGLHPVSALLAGASLFVVMLAENARIPVDDPTTHLELTMIHEVMVLDHGGPDLAFVNYGSALKFWLLGLVVVRTLVPVRGGLAAQLFLTLAALLAVAVLVGVVESVMARLRLTRVPQLLSVAGALALLALLSSRGLLS